MGDSGEKMERDAGGAAGTKATIIYITGIYDTLDLFTDKLREAFEEMGHGSFVYDARLRGAGAGQSGIAAGQNGIAAGTGDIAKDALCALLEDSRVAKDALAGQDSAAHGALEENPSDARQAALQQPAAARSPAALDAATRSPATLDAVTRPFAALDAATRPPAALHPPAVCVTFNNLGYNLALSDGRNVWDAYGVPYVNILMDHPFHYARALRAMPGTATVLCTDRNHVSFVRRFFPNVRRVGFLPHAGVELGSRHKPLKERGIDVLYAGALPIYTVSGLIPDLRAIPEVDGEEMAREVLSELVAHPERTTEGVIEDYVRSRRSDISDQRLLEIIVQMRFLDSYATSFFREQAVRILVESGIRVTAYGTGWDQCDWSDSPFLRYGGKVAAPQILPMMNDAKIVLNTMTWYKAGAHDRVFNGMLSGAAVLTDDSAYLREEFADGRELSMFSLRDVASLPDRAFDIFGHLDRAQEMAERGLIAARERHTWRSRAEWIACEALRGAL